MQKLNISSKMPRGKELTAEEKAKIEVYIDSGKSYGYIAGKLHRDKSAIGDFVRNRMGKPSKKRKGRPRKISKRDERQIARAAWNETKTLNQIKAECQLEVHKSTVSRAIKRILHIVREKMKAAPKLTVAHKAARVEFARANMARDWSLVGILGLYKHVFYIFR